MEPRILISHPIPPILSDSSQTTDITIPGTLEMPSSGGHSNTSSINLILMRTLKFSRPKSLNLMARERLSRRKKEPDTEMEEILRWQIDPHSECRVFESRQVIPFTVRVPGYLPATTTTPVGTSSYNLVASIATNLGEVKKVAAPIHIQRLVVLPGVPSSLLHYRKFPDCQVATKLLVPAVVRPTGSFSAKLYLLSQSVPHHNTSARLRVRQLNWYIEECTRVLPAAYQGGNQHPQELQIHTRKVAEGTHRVAPSGLNALFTDTKEEDEINFSIGFTYKTRSACTTTPGLDTLSLRPERPPAYTVSHSLWNRMRISHT